MHRISYSILVACFSASPLVSPIIVEADTPNFSGSFTLTGSKGAFKIKKGEICTLQVSQTESAIEVTRVMDDHQNIYKCPLNGGEGKYTSPDGTAGTCKAHLKGRSLVLETLVTTHPQPKSPTVQVHTRERWELSSDLKTLTIKSNVGFRLPPVNDDFLNAVTLKLVEPWTEIFTRN